jgi:hypothetical protein
MLEQIIFELCGLTSIALGGYIFTKTFSVLPLSKELDAQQNEQLFIAIPCIIYTAYRIIFGTTLFISSKIRYTWASRLFSYSTIGASVYILGYFPAAVEPIQSLYSTTVGDLPALLIQALRPSFDVSVSFGYRIATLLAGWFVVLFALELLLRMVLWMLQTAVRVSLGFVIKARQPAGSQKGPV